MFKGLAAALAAAAVTATQAVIAGTRVAAGAGPAAATEAWIKPTKMKRKERRVSIEDGEGCIEYPGPVL